MNNNIVSSSVNNNNNDNDNTISLIGCLGISIATVLSWTTWHNIWWCIVHGCCGWFYVIYYAIKYL